MFEIFKMGCDSFQGQEFKVDRPNGFGAGCYLLLYIKTEAYVITDDGEYHNTEPGTFILYNKMSHQRYGISSDRYINDWMQFDAGKAIMDSLNFPYDIPIYIGKNLPIAELFRMIGENYFGSGAFSMQTCSLLLNAMLNMVADYQHQGLTYNHYYSELLNLRREIYDHPEYKWQINEIAEKMHLSSGYFQQIYKDTFGSSCGTDIINSRIETAKYLLKCSSLAIYEIAVSCGYSSDVHFSRQFKQITGYPPSKYRQINVNS